MTSHALSEPTATGMADVTRRVRGLVFFGFPLHPPGRPGTKRAEHLERVNVPCCSYRARAIPWQILPSCVPCVRSWHLAQRYISRTPLTTPSMS